MPEPANKGQTYPVEILTEDEVSRLLRACSSRAPTGVRNRALLAVLYRGGLRINEALSLMPRDVDRERGTVNIRHGKGDFQRVIGLDPGAFALLDRWLDRRATLGANGRHELFCTIAGGRFGPVSDAYVRQLLPRLRKRAGIEKRVHAHGLRHTHAAELAEEGLPVNLIQAQLGHGSLRTTDRYLRHVAPTRLVEALQGRDWPGGA